MPEMKGAQYVKEIRQTYSVGMCRVAGLTGSIRMVPGGPGTPSDPGIPGRPGGPWRVRGRRKSWHASF